MTETQEPVLNSVRSGMKHVTGYQSWVVIASGAFHYINRKALLNCPTCTFGVNLSAFSHTSCDFDCCTKWRAWQRAADPRETKSRARKAE